jgi:hypothetical protein
VPKRLCDLRLLRPGGSTVSVVRVIAAAILDRVLNHAVTVNIRGNSYRLEDKLKAGLVEAGSEAVS